MSSDPHIGEIGARAISGRERAMNFTADVLAMLTAASELRRFNRALWPHHRAFYELATRAPAGGDIRRRATDWDFAPSDDGLWSVRDLGPTLWNLSAEGWLQRTADSYEISDEMRLRGQRLLDLLAPPDRHAVRVCARQWTRWSKTASKNCL